MMIRVGGAVMRRVDAPWVYSSVSEWNSESFAVISSSYFLTHSSTSVSLYGGGAHSTTFAQRRNPSVFQLTVNTHEYGGVRRSTAEYGGVRL
jgi:hypothetical protein